MHFKFLRPRSKVPGRPGNEKRLLFSLHTGKRGVTMELPYNDVERLKNVFGVCKAAQYHNCYPA